MPAMKRKRTYASRARTARAKGRTGYANILRKGTKRRRTVANLQRQITSISRSIETKEGCRRITFVQMAHNGLTVFNDADGNVFNPFICAQGTADPMAAGGMVRIGDTIQLKSLLFKFFVEASLGRSKVYFRFMLIRMAKGDTLNRDNLFKKACNNCMIDQINTERFTVVASKTFNVTSPNTVAATLGASGAITGIPATGTVAGITGNRVFTMSIPGRKFGKGGVLTYENGSTNQLKFYDYRFCCVAYDWYGTPQDSNNVGFINDGYVKTYFKDA